VIQGGSEGNMVTLAPILTDAGTRIQMQQNKEEVMRRWKFFSMRATR
jgi:hypothetical protein